MPAFSISWSSAKLRESPSEIAARGVRSADDKGELPERRIGQAIMADERVEAAALAFVRKVHVGDVVRGRVALLRRGEHLLRRNVEEFRSGIDEAREQPRAGDAVDLGPLARHPARVRAGRLAVEGAARGLPAFLDSAFQDLRGDAVLGERLCDALTYFIPAHAARDHAARPRQLARPL